MITLTREEAQELLNALTYVGDAKDIYSDTIETFRARLAQPEPEPVACAACSGRGWYTCGASDMRLKCPECKGKKTAPPQREWQGLTAEDLAEIPPSCYEGAIWADARLKEKNT